MTATDSSAVLTFRSILCPVDFSEHSRHALRWAAAFADRFRSRLTVVSVVDPLLAEAARSRWHTDLAKSETEPVLRDFVAATWPDGKGPSAPALIKTPLGEPTDVILETAAADAVDLIVMGTQGLGGLRKWLLGSTTERVLRRTRVPVLGVPLASEESRLTDAHRKFEVSSILAATDFSEPATFAVGTAVRLARTLSATLTLAHVVEPVTAPPQWRPLMESSEETRVADARTRLQALTDEYCKSQTCEPIVSSGRAAEVIGSLAQDRGVQLVVMGLASDHGRLARRPGSIAYRVLSSTTVPVLVVPTGQG